MNKYYCLTVADKIADVYIFGDITSWEWLESDVSSYTLPKELQGLEADRINVHINSYGGDAAEGLAIYNTLKNHKAKVVTICDGFACSAASIVFMAGDERIMNTASLLMIHNAWVRAAGNAEDLRKAADDLEIISKTAANAYAEKINISREELDSMLDAETWIKPQDALEMGFATSLTSAAASGKAAATARKSLFKLVAKGLSSEEAPEPDSAPGAAPDDEPQEASAPQEENKTLKFLNALLGGKDVK